MKIDYQQASQLWNLAFGRKCAKHILDEIIDHLSGDAQLIARAIVYPDADVPDDHKIVAVKMIMQIDRYIRQQKERRSIPPGRNPNLSFRD